MIKLERIHTPIKLNPDFVTEKTTEFIANGANVWNVEWLKSSLLDLSFKKCSYCECDLTEESKYMEVEHFEDKDTNKTKVLVWDNLLPSCKRCNGHKSTHNVITEPIVNPFIDEPANHFFLKLYRLKPKENDLKAETTLSVLDLNNSERVVKVRFQLGEALQKTIDRTKEKLESFEENNSAIRRTKLVSTMAEILLECQRNKIYSATCATVLHTDYDYLQIRQKMIDLNIWNEELEQLHGSSLELILLE